MSVLPSPEAPVAVPPVPIRGRILVVDDEPLVGAALRRALGREHDVTIETAGRAALERIRRGEVYHLILCDLRMPDITGWELRTAVAEIAPAIARNILFFSGELDSDREAAVLPKPIPVSELRRVVGDAVRAAVGGAA